MCPHILRYLTTAVITNRRRRQAHHQQLLKDLVKVIQQVSELLLHPTSLSLLSDPIISAYSPIQQMFYLLFEQN